MAVCSKSARVSSVRRLLPLSRPSSSSLLHHSLSLFFLFSSSLLLLLSHPHPPIELSRVSFSSASRSLFLLSSWLRIRPPPPLLPRSALPTLRPSLLLPRILHRKQLRRRRLRRPVSLRKKSHLVRVLCCEMFFFYFRPGVLFLPSCCSFSVSTHPWRR